jgi:hypothetical protein
VGCAAHQQRRELEKEGVTYAGLCRGGGIAGRGREPMLPDDPREMV